MLLCQLAFTFRFNKKTITIIKEATYLVAGVTTQAGPKDDLFEIERPDKLV